ncbi:uncharacterized protein LOC124455059 isoform X2 [Xenia sp. Carnegie-2017]|uniref:uncharacterized protein LOC124455059 isoform X2 n=1 Tax=Xenia sp. Carnegie-2017 TaxID=2897299 RepID=UPI001F0400D2|nr:uncharacterized protein LOC124455059 isoform X2 [Xenia sp. Carnegie-2017]
MNETLTNCPVNFDCVDTIGSFACVCRGRILDGDCIREGFVRYHIELTVIEPFNLSLCIQNSTAFAEFQTRFNESIQVVYAGDPSFVSVKINELRDGKNDKVIIDAYMTYRVPDSLNLLFEAVRNNSLPNFNVSNNELRVVVTGTCALSTCPANSTCQRLTRRTYTCPCEDGFYADGFICTELVNVNVQLTIAREFTTSLGNSSSQEFMDLQTYLRQALTRQFQDTPNFQDIKILRFRNGSTIVDFSVRYRRDPSQNVKVAVANTLYEKITKPGRIGNFTVEKAEIDGTPPSPQGLMATGVAVTSINVTWQQPDSFNVFGIKHYRTRLNPARGMNEKNITATMGTNNATFQNLLDNTSYAISVYAVNDDGVGDVAMITVTTNEDVNECSNSALFTCPEGLRCVNTLGSFRCICEGVLGSDGSCTRQGAVELNRFVLTVSRTFTPGLANKSSSDFREFQNEFRTSMEAVYNTRQFGFVQTVINELRAGSVIVDADVTFEQLGANGLSVLFTAVRNGMVGTFNVNSNALVVVITGTCNEITCHANSTCFTLSPTTVECRCLPGFYPNGVQCLEFVNVTIKITLDGEFTSDLNDNTSALFIELEGNLTRELRIRFQDTPNFQDVEILGFRNGSIIVDARIISRQGPQNAKVIVADTIEERLINGTLSGLPIQGVTVLGTPPPPQGLMVTGVAVTSINVTWQQPNSFNVFGIKNYQTRLNPERGMNEKVITATMGTNNAMFQNLLNSTSYAISVYAVNDDGVGDVAMITVTTNDINECNNSAFMCPEGLSCVNTLGSFRCICKGVVGSDGSCTRQGEVELNRIFLTVNRTFTPALANKSSSAFRMFQDEFRTSMAAVYNTRQFGYVQTVINELRNGSVIVDADVTFDQVGANGLSVLFTAVRNEMVGAFDVRSNALVIVITGTCNDITCHANSTCFTLSPTTVECRCLPGFYPNGRQCLELVNVTIKITLDGEFTSDLNDNTSALFIELAGNLTRELRDKFQDTPNFQDVEILRFRNGSIIVDVRIILRQSPQNAKVIVADSFIERLINGTLSGFPIQGATVAGPPPPPQDVTITHVGEKSITFTWQHRASFVAFGIKIYEIRSNPPLPGNALRNRTPEVATLSETFGGLESDTFYTINITAINDDGSAERLITAKTDDDSDDTTLIVVLVVVLSFVLIAIIMLVLFFRHRRRQKQVYQTSGGRRRPSINMDDHWRNQYDNAGQDI